MKQLAGAALALLMVAAVFVAVPVRADHVQEPTSPIESVQWRVYPYPQGVLQACGPLVDAGAEPYVFTAGQNIRFELDVRTEAQPSEHWEGRFNLSKIINPGHRREGSRNVIDWVERHSNSPAHSRRNFEFWQNNFYDLQAGTYELHAQFTGFESGNVVTDTCRITVE